MRSRRLPLFLFAVAVFALAGGEDATAFHGPATAVVADTDTVIPGGVQHLVILPLPVPDSIKPVRLTACFDLEASGKATLIQRTLTRDSAYNRAVLETLLTYRFKPSTLRGFPVRDTICIRATAGERR
jgi:hypothetical protein